MAWFCKGCGERRGGAMCKKWCREKYGDMGAERIPPLDGVIFFNDDGSGIPRWEIRKREASPRYVAKYVVGPRPQGWLEALGRMSERAAVIIGTGLKVPEC